MDKAVSDLWWKNAIVYCLDVETFVDSDGDGIGDFRGLIRRIDYLAGLGITCLWLMPFYPTSNRDDGYDVTDYYSVDPRFGTLGDFVELVRTATERGIRIIADLVVNHTSTQHRWFQESRKDRNSRFRDWYVWSDEPLDHPEEVIFPGQEDSNWEYDEEAGQYFLHRFYSFQPDLNVANPDVRDEINRIIGFWMELGVSGFRVDAVPYLIGAAGIEDQMPQEPHRMLVGMKAFMSRRRGDAVMIGEVNLDPGERVDFFGDIGEEMTGLFNFILTGALFHALATEDAGALAGHLRSTPQPPEPCQWINFVRNHDELNLSRLPDDEADAVLDSLPPRERDVIFGRGIRRRLPPMLDGDERRIKLAMSAMLTFPGTPVLFYGEEIGMGDDPSLPGRLAVRTPMQWSGAPNGGFSQADADDLVRRVVDEGRFSYEKVNVAEQRRRSDSLLSWTERVLRIRKQCPELGWGEWTVLDTGGSAVLGTRYDWIGETVVVLHNFSPTSTTATLRIEADSDAELLTISEVFADDAYEELEVGTDEVDLNPYGYRWFRLERAGSAPMVA